MDWTFLVTGGKCQLVDTDPMRAKEEMGTVQMVFTSAACKVAGGKWSGGHDLSGHVFLLTHASLFLWSELLPILSLSGAAGWESVGVLALLGLWWWMLLMTGVYFHTWLEKVSCPLITSVWSVFTSSRQVLMISWPSGNWLDRRNSPMGGVICVGTEVAPHRPERFWSSRYLILFARCGFRVSLLIAVAEG